MAPTCPLCGTNDGVESSRNHAQGEWLCCGCWTLFDGDEDEWHRMSRKRKMRAESVRYWRAVAIKLGHFDEDGTPLWPRMVGSDIVELKERIAAIAERFKERAP